MAFMKHLDLVQNTISPEKATQLQYTSAKSSTKMTLNANELKAQMMPFCKSSTIRQV